MGRHYPHAQWRPTDAKDTAPGRNGTPAGEMRTWRNLKSNQDPQAHKLTESRPVPVGGSSGIGAHIRFGGKPNWTMHPCTAKILRCILGTDWMGLNRAIECQIGQVSPGDQFDESLLQRDVIRDPIPAGTLKSRMQVAAQMDLSAYYCTTSD